ncbi:MAG: undecaprenyldiphospho-muramoylpentapeptide beta-N-acetylglucosaminyltransferase [Bacteroidales bacterium]|nr:undecaprenyldiphospho-muramoylpentapeptide beta-N-acetylglucosaminyltransferase [Bacteroidales bacterium]
MKNNFKIIISGGGTGGHVFPAIAIANEIKAKCADAEILFVGAEGRIEMEKVPAAGYKIEGLWISGLQRKMIFKNLLLPIKLISSLIKVNKILNNFKPDVVVGVGGYASGPLLRVAAMKNIPSLIQEQNSYPGITNKILAKKVDKICVAYNDMEKFFPQEKIVITGNPVRKDILDTETKRSEAIKHFELENKNTLLVIGGSLGARTINESINKNLELLSKNNIQVIWQTGKYYFEEAKKSVSALNLKNIKVFDFINKMDMAYAAADVVVSRAGAIAISELCIVGKPAILIPSPNVAEDHQTKNAMALVNENAAILIKDSEAIEKSGEEIIALFNNAEKQKQLSGNIKRLAKRNATELIVNEILNLIKKIR